MENQEWITEIKRLKKFFETATMPAGPVQLSKSETYADLRKGIDADIIKAEANVGKWWFQSSMARLQEIEKWLKENATK